MAKSAPALSLEAKIVSFARSLQITEGLFFATRQNEPKVSTPIEVLEKGVRGQSSEDKAKKPGESNPQTVEYAIVPQGHDGLRLSFSVRFMPLSLKPHACNDTGVFADYQRLAGAYRSAGGFRTLAQFYVWNIANARFAWRNRFQTDVMTVRVESDKGTALVFDPFRLRLNRPATSEDLAAALVEGTPEVIDELIDGIAHGLSNETGNAFSLRVAWNATMEPGQEVFPSQEYLRDELKRARKNESSDQYGKPLKVLAKLPVSSAGRELMQASMHSQKIGAALRHIDIWHGSDEYPYPIAVNPYGGVQDTGHVLRMPNTKRSFYDLRAQAAKLIGELEAAKAPEDISGDAHFVMANLVRGGLFVVSNEKAEAAA